MGGYLDVRFATIKLSAQQAEVDPKRKFVMNLAKITSNVYKWPTLISSKLAEIPIQIDELWHIIQINLIFSGDSYV